MRINFNCYLDGRKSTKELMADEHFRRLIYHANKGYYLGMGCCLNFIHGRMVDAIGNLRERGLFRREVKLYGRKAMEEMERLMRQMKESMEENMVFGGDDYQYWLDVVDAMEVRFSPKIDRLEKVMAEYLRKFDLQDTSFRSSICAVSNLLCYAKANVYDDIREERMAQTLVDINLIFPGGDGEGVLKWWKKMEDAAIPTRQDIDFGQSKSCQRALLSFIILFSKTATFRGPMRYAFKQRASRNPEIDWKKRRRQMDHFVLSSDNVAV